MTVRVFHRGPLAPQTTIELDDDEHHYLARVRRARVAMVVEVLDGAGGIARATVRSVAARRSVLQIDEALDIPPPPMLELLLGMPDAAACLDAIAAACELGCTRIALLRCARSPATSPGAARIDKVVRSAMRQCGRPRPPELVAPLALADALPAAPGELRGAFAWEALRGASTPLPADLPARILVGPEGGLTADEADACRASGLVPISLGPWTLRTETAATAGLACVARAARERGDAQTARGQTGCARP